MKSVPNFAFHFLGTQIAIITLASLASFATFANPHEYILANGLKLIVKEDHRSPVVISQIWYKAGSIDELNGTTGIAHALEHMMFKGTKRFARVNSQGALQRRVGVIMRSQAKITQRIFNNYTNPDSH